MRDSAQRGVPPATSLAAQPAGDEHDATLGLDGGVIPARPRPAVSRVARWHWRGRNVRRLFYQVLALAAVAALAAWLLGNTLDNMRERGIRSGFDFLLEPGGFDISESLIPFSSAQPYWKAFLVGLLNTLRVALVGIVLTTVLGVLVGVGRLSRNALVRGLCHAYVEVFRNIPLLIQLLVWYLVFLELLPTPRAPLDFAGVAYLSKSGLALAVPSGPGWGWVVLGLCVSAGAAFWLHRRQVRRFVEDGGRPPGLWLPAMALLAGPLLGWWLGGRPTAWDVPAPGGFSIEGGLALTPEFMALLLGLTAYTTAFTAEVVRAGLGAVGHGQAEAAASLGLSRRLALRLVVLPQALRVIVPPLTNQYLNLTKNSSLAVAIGYPDVVAVANTALNQTGRAVECISLIMLVYLTLSVATSAAMGVFNRRVAIRER